MRRPGWNSGRRHIPDRSKSSGDEYRNRAWPESRFPFLFLALDAKVCVDGGLDGFMRL